MAYVLRCGSFHDTYGYVWHEAMMRLISTVFDSGAEFLEQHENSYPSGALFCLTKANLAIGERILLEIQFPELPNPSVLRGQIVSLVHGHGAMVACEASDRASFQFVMDAARGELLGDAGIVRHHPRFPAVISVKFRILEMDEPMEQVTALTADLGSGGASITSISSTSTAQIPKVGTRISLRLVTTECGPIAVSGRVAWAKPSSGFGIRFDQRGPASAAPLRPLIRRICETGELPLWASALPDSSFARPDSPFATASVLLKRR